MSVKSESSLEFLRSESSQESTGFESESIHEILWSKFEPSHESIRLESYSSFCGLS